MLEKMEPFNIDLLILNRDQIKMMGEVKDLSIFESSSKNFNPDGLFSTEIFGRVGSEERNKRFGYVNLHIKVLHPLIYKHIASLKKLYSDIMSGKAFAKWDSKSSDFVLSNANDGETGFEFFMSKYDKLKLETRNSDAREFKIKLIKKYKSQDILIDRFLVLPAGLRDYIVDDAGKPSEDEVNAIYRKLLTTTNALENISTSSNDATILDPIRFRIQTIITEIYDHFISLMDGKKKFIQNKWTKRAIRDSTRNVITPIPSVIHDLTNSENRISFNNTVIGLYQYSKAINPITKYQLNLKILGDVFDIHSNTARLVDKKTLTTVNVDIKPKTKDMWTSDEGLNGVINKLAQDELRSEPIEVEGYYLALIYDDGKKVKLIKNTLDIPDDIDKRYLRPITYAELIYLAIYKDVKKYPGFLTRYPVAGLGGIYPSIPYLKTTVKARTVSILGFDWEEEDKVYEYPILTEAYFNSLSPHFSKLERLGAD